jgi:lysozyme
MTLFGIDVASYQGTPNWAKVQASGIAYAFAKATQGTAYASSVWNYDETEMMKLKDFLPGSYHFLSATDDPVAQAQYFVAKLKSPQDFAIALDVERYTSGGVVRKPTAAMAREWVGEFRRLLPGHPIIGYFPRWYWNEENRPDLGFFDTLWASAYVPGSGTPNELFSKSSETPWTPFGGRSVQLLQFSSNGAVPGIAGPVDLDAFRGTLLDLRALSLPLSVPQPAPVPPAGHAPVPLPPLAVDGILGPKTVKALQRCIAFRLSLSIPVDGILSSNFVRHLQRYLKVTVDGVLGPITKKAIQKKAVVTQDGVMGSITIKALQRRLNAGAF